MFDLKAGWNLSFAGCGFLGVYHIGVSSCLLERAPYLVHRAKMICGASAGALTAAMLTSRACTEKCCEDVVELSKEARKRNLGPLHPAFDIIKVLRTGLQRNIPEDAHTQASGKLGVSLTRVSDGKNVLVCHFNSKDELIQALICSCFIPVYCGLIPPAFRGVRYVDGGFSDNLPQSELKNTITVSPFSGESDICPKDNSSSFHELQLTNTSIQVNCGNLDRISKALFPPEPKIMAEMCQQGYKDALRFLEKNNMLSTENPTTDHVLTQDTPAYCCAGINTEPAKWWMLWRLRLSKEHHWWLDEQLVNLLPAALKKVFCDACKEKCSIISQLNCLLPVRVASYILMPYTLPVESTYSAVRRFVKWMPEVPANAQWCFEVAGRAWKCVSKKMGSAILVHWCVSEQPPPKQIHMYTGSDDDS